MSNEVLDIAGVINKFGIGPALIIDYLTLIGDKVDNVPGVDKCGPKTAVKWLQAYGSLAGVMEHAADIGGAVGAKLQEALARLPLSQQLITIKCDVDLDAELPQGMETLRRAGQDVAQLREMFQRFGFHSWLRELDQQDRAPAPAAQARLQTPTDDLFALAAPEIAPAPAPAARAAEAAVVDAADAAPVPVMERHYTTILTEAQLAQWLEKIDAATVVSLDTETTSLEQMSARLVGISLAVTPGEAAYLPLAHRAAGVGAQLDFDATLARLKPWLEDPTKNKLGQNLKYDRHVFANHGIRLAGVLDDTMLASYVVESHLTHNMDDLAERHLQESTIHFADVCGKGAKQICFDEVDLDTATRYAAEDADITLRLNAVLQPMMDASQLAVYRNIELPVAQVLFIMERNGVLIDRQRLGELSHQFGSRMLELENQAYELAQQPFNLNSPKQLQEILFSKLGISTKGVRKTPSGGFSTDESVLETLALDHPLPKCLLEYRGLAKLKSTYTDKLPLLIRPDTGRVHTTYAQAVAVTGRLASSDPNLQNIPIRSQEGRRVREAFIAAPGHVIVSADYSQIELRIMAHLSGDEGMLKAFAAGEDIHRATAAEVFGIELDAVSSEQRRYAKTINFGLIYGMSAFGLAKQLEIERSAAQQFIDRYFMRYPRVAEYMQSTREAALERGYVETVFGRRLYLPEIRSSNVGRRNGAERAAINAPMQGSAADLIKLAMIAVQDWLQTSGSQSRLIMQVHDELVLEVPEAERESLCAELVRLMASVAELKVPLLAEVGVGPNWGAAH
jgi:DNA polymerase-1